MTISNVAWVRDHHRRPVLELEIDGRPAHIPSRQKSELLRRGILEGLVFFASERSHQVPNLFMRGNFGPELTASELIGCTDDPRVFALYEEMGRAIRAGAWRPGPRRDQPEDRPAPGTGPSPLEPGPSDRGHPTREEAQRPC